MLLNIEMSMKGADGSLSHVKECTQLRMPEQVVSNVCQVFIQEVTFFAEQLLH